MVGVGGVAGCSFLVAFALTALGGPAAAAGAQPAVHVHAFISAGSKLEVNGSVVPAPKHATAELETRRKGKWGGRAETTISSHGVFALSLKVARGGDKMAIRVAVVRGGRLLVRSSTTVARKSASQSHLGRQSHASPAASHPPEAVVSGPLSELRPGQSLTAGEQLVSPNGKYRLLMQEDGNLVVYEGSKALWSSGTWGNPGAFTTMQADGNLVVYLGGKALWDAGTWGFPGASLILQDDANLVIYHAGHPVWDRLSGYIGDQLNGWHLEPGAYLLSRDHHYKLVMQGDGNLVLYQEEHALWSSGTNGHPGAAADMQSDGNFVIYSGGNPIWNSSTDGFPGAHLQLQDDSNAVIYQDGHPVWDWGSGYLGNQLNGWHLEPGAYLLSPNHAYELIMQGDGNLVLYQDGHALWSSGTGGYAGAATFMQPDGNLVVYDGGGTARWNSGTGGYLGAYLLLQNDANAVIYQGSTPIWDWPSGKLVGGGGTASTGERILDEASKWAGRPYCFDGGNQNGPTLGTTDPENGLRCGTSNYNPAGTPGFDCTGLTLYAVYQVTGKLLAHSGAQATDAVAKGGQHIYNQSELQPGDLVYFRGSFGNFVHAGVYAGVVNGQPSFWSAVTEGLGVRLETMAWEGGFVGGVRF